MFRRISLKWFDISSSVALETDDKSELNDELTESGPGFGETLPLLNNKINISNKEIATIRDVKQLRLNNK